MLLPLSSLNQYDMLLHWLLSPQTSLIILLFDHTFLCSTMRDDQVPRSRIARLKSHATRHNGSLSSVPPPHLKARVTIPPTFLGNNWIIDHHDFTCLLPVASAAAELLDFYEDIAAFAALTDIIPLQMYRMWVGDIMMEVMAPSEHDIQWIAVQRFAEWMIELTRRGYINTYQINFVDRTTGLLLTFSLWVGYTRTMTNVLS